MNITSDVDITLGYFAKGLGQENLLYTVDLYVFPLKAYVIKVHARLLGHVTAYWAEKRHPIIQNTSTRQSVEFLVLVYFIVKNICMLL